MFFMRAYYALEAPIVPGWRLLDPNAPIAIKKNAILEDAPFRGKTDVVSFYPGRAVPNPRRWREAPHVALANLGYPSRDRTTGELIAFLKQYGTLIADDGGLAAGGLFEMSVAEFREIQETLQDAWRRRDAKLLWFSQGFENFDHFNLRFTWAGRGLAQWPADCWTYLRLLLTRDLAAGRAKVCRNPKCNTPAFVSKRNDAIFCSHKCAVDLVNEKNRLRKRGKK
jgi:hypothetical protein